MTGNSLTAQIAQDWRNSSYYNDAERQDWLLPFWEMPRFRSKFDQLDLTNYVELACGHGRHTGYILGVVKDPRIQNVYLIDVVGENVEYCSNRFASDPRVHTLCNNGSDLSELQDSSISSIFSYDAMVHFEYDAVLSYIKESHRVLMPGGRALLHHSNYDQNPGGHYQDNPHWRNFMTSSLFSHASLRSGFKVLEQEVTNWNQEMKIDCISLLEKPK